MAERPDIDAGAHKRRHPGRPVRDAGHAATGGQDAPALYPGTSRARPASRPAPAGVSGRQAWLRQSRARSQMRSGRGTSPCPPQPGRREAGDAEHLHRYVRQRRQRPPWLGGDGWLRDLIGELTATVAQEPAVVLRSRCQRRPPRLHPPRKPTGRGDDQLHQSTADKRICRPDLRELISARRKSIRAYWTPCAGVADAAPWTPGRTGPARLRLT
jgi:hypothetical protein